MIRLTVDSTEQFSTKKLNEDQAWIELKSLLKKRIDDGIAGEVSIKSIENIINEELAFNESSLRPNKDS